jgi:hypothetical protein
MSTIEILRNEAKQYIDEADEKAIKMVIAMLEINAEGDEDADWWKNMPDDVKAEVEEAIKESDEGKGIQHEEAMKMIKEMKNAL